MGSLAWSNSLFSQLWITLPGMRVMMAESLQPSASASWAMRWKVERTTAVTSRRRNVRVIWLESSFGEIVYNGRRSICAIRADRRLHPVVIRSAAAFGRNPRDDLIRVGDVAGLTVYAVRRVQADALAIGLRRVVDHFVDVGGAEILTGAAKFLHAF